MDISFLIGYITGATATLGGMIIGALLHEWRDK